MNLFDIVGLSPLMARSEGKRDIKVSVIDGPARLGHPAFSAQRIHEIKRHPAAACQIVESVACNHGTFVLGMLAAKRGSGAPAICPGCTFILRPIFTETTDVDDPMPVSTPEQVGMAIIDSVTAGALVINLSAALTHFTSQGAGPLEQALNRAAQRGVLVVAAAGNQGTIAASVITGNPWVIPVISCDLQGRPTRESNLGSSIGRRGLAAPGENIISIGADGKLGTFHGTSAATPFVTGTIALLWSEFPKATAAQIKGALMKADGGARRAIVPALLNAWAAYVAMSAN
jgi:subtilisin family serine protease